MSNQKNSCEDNIHECAQQTFRDLAEEYVIAEAKAFEIPDENKDAYNRRLNTIYNNFMEKEAFFYTLNAEEIKTEITNLKKEMEKFKKELESLKNISKLIQIMGTIAQIVTALSGLNVARFTPRVFSATSPTTKSFVPTQPELHSLLPNLVNGGAATDFIERNATEQFCLEQLIEERDFLKEVILNMIQANQNCGN